MPYEHENYSFIFPFFIAICPHVCIVKLFSNMFLCQRRLKEDAAKVNSFTRGFNLGVSASIGNNTHCANRWCDIMSILAFEGLFIENLS